MKFDINKIKRITHMGLLCIKSHASEIEAVAGGLCVVGGTVLLIKNAEAIVTDSFHAAVFSMIYHKPFLCSGTNDKSQRWFHGKSSYRFFERV